MVTSLSMPAASSQQDSGDEETSVVEDQMISTLPKAKGWFTHHLHLYQGFWYYLHALSGVLFAQHHFNALSTDIVLATNPKCGTTWLKSLAFAIKNRASAAPNDQISHSTITQLLTASPHALVESLEFEIFERDSLKEFETLPPPRLVGTHIPFSSLPESVHASGCRVVYMCRDPKDMFVSTWHFIGKLNHMKEVPLVSKDITHLCTNQILHSVRNS